MKGLFKSKSQAGQDVFAYSLFGSNGLYLEVGANHPKSKNNTFNLEIKAGWRGISIELDEKNCKPHWEESDRKNKIYFADALNFDYVTALKENDLPMHLNYLSCDIEPVENTFAALQLIIKSGISFDCITFEDDRYRNNLDYNIKATEFLKVYGYKPAVVDVYAREPERLFETWFVRKEINFKETTFTEWRKENS